MRKIIFNIHLLFLVLIFTLASCSKKNAVPPQSKICMDTVCSVNAFDDGTEKLYSEIFSRLDEIENTFSTTLPKSLVSKVNKMAGTAAVEVTNDFLYVLTTAQKISKITNGALDVSAGPLIDLWGINTDHAKIPSAEEIEKAKKLTGYEKIEITGHRVFLPEKGMSINLGAVVKGYAADEIVSILKKHRVQKAIIDLGGNIYAYGRKADNIPWIVGIKNPQAPEDDPLLKTYITNSSVVTSGNYERYFEKDGKRYHHILNTKTGAPAESGISSATIICKKSIIADCLSTAAFILGKEKTEEIIPAVQKEFGTTVACIFIHNDTSWEETGKIKVIPY